MDKTIKSKKNERNNLFEDCSEDNLKNGILRLTSQNLVFEKTKGRIATLSKELLGEKIEIRFDDILQVKSEGRIIKKLVVQLKNNKIYKFGVLSPNSWEKEIHLRIQANANPTD